MVVPFRQRSVRVIYFSSCPPPSLFSHEYHYSLFNIHCFIFVYTGAAGPLIDKKRHRGEMPLTSSSCKSPFKYKIQFYFSLVALLVVPVLLKLFSLQRRPLVVVNDAPVQGPTATAAICAIQKWGLRYIDEWVDYHLALGFQTIFIYDNSEDFELQGWYSKKFEKGTGRVKITHFPGDIRQFAAFTKCMEGIQERQTHSWIAFIDIDEFFVIKDTKKFPLITDVLKSISQDAGGLAVNWQVFDWNNQTAYEAKPLSLRFDRFDKNWPANRHVKTIARTDRVRGVSGDPHHFIYFNQFKAVDTNGEIVEGPFNYRKPKNVLTINHYHTKSLEEYKSRCKRGSPDKGSLEKHPPCKPEEEILAQWISFMKRDDCHFDFDDSVWKLLKERVPTYRKYEM
mmetsp:Transcript_5569/g.12199  ORF Transcript_5569/g.12199 Transcript_5569/m.12199 type:complete len:396 (+) Transcript_5569:200-1387(+)